MISDLTDEEATGLPAPLRDLGPRQELPPRRAWPVLLAIADVTAGHGRGDHWREPARLPGGGLISPTLVYLAELARGLRDLVDRARVVPILWCDDDGEWWGRWEPFADPPVRRWLADLARALPPAAVRPDTFETSELLVADIARELTDCLVRERTAEVGLGLEPGHHRSPLLDWLTSLDTGGPIDYWPAASLRTLASALDSWRGGPEAVDYQPLFVVREPEADGPWTVLFRLRSRQDPSAVIDPERSGGIGADPRAFALAEIGRAGTVFAPVLDWLRAQPGFEFTLDADAVVDLLAHAETLMDAGFAVLAPNLAPPLSLTLSASGGLSSGRLGLAQVLDYSWHVAVGDHELTEAELRTLAAAKSSLVRVHGRWLRTSDPDVEQALALAASTRHGTLGDFLQHAGGITRLPAPVTAVHASGWLADLLAGTTASSAEIAPTAVQRRGSRTAPASLVGTLRPYQVRGLAWLDFMSQLGLGAILADDMGLGKTVQLLALLADEQERGELTAPTLLVCPMSVVGNWQRESARFTPTLRTYVHHGTDRAGGSALTERAAQADLVITTYSLLARDADDLAQVTWSHVALDEAQHVKNASTKAARSARHLTARHRLALTGTPVENRLEELRALLDFVNPGMLGSAQAFKKAFAGPIERDGDTAAAERLSRITRPFILRRVKTDPTVIADLPEKDDMTVRANLTAEQAGLYQAVVDDMLAQVGSMSGMQRRGAVLAALTKLKQICNHPAQFLHDGSPIMANSEHRSGKLALVEDIIETILADGEKVICFTQFTAFGAMVAPWLARRFDTEVPFFHGGTTAAGRDAMIASFDRVDGPPILLLSLRAGGTGINLTAASQVIHLDRWWNPAVEDQATDRAHRIGQRRRVQVRKLLCLGTVEERIDQLIASKRALAEIVGTGEQWIGDLNNDELRDLVALSADAVGE